DEVALDDPVFSPDGGRKGLWTPTDFLSEIGGGIYFLQPFDPKKTPVLFVHGAGGNPREFESLIADLDRERFQPWVFYYPSGLRLGTVVQLLDGVMTNLRREYPFQQVMVTAHSMGGLVAMSYLKLLAARGDGRQVPLLVTLSTPWRGHDAAELGVKYAPVAIPSWIDMQVDSDFQRALFNTPMPANTRFGLFFGYHGDSSDGTISLVSQLRPEAQLQALRVLGFDETHTSILHASAVSQAWRNLIETAAPQR
uniref:esterase/lipase family protein n=1 Tax=Niveibacterium sp. TaxID=2017444 RepID=UPI0035B3634A